MFAIHSKVLTNIKAQKDTNIFLESLWSYVHLRYFKNIFNSYFSVNANRMVIVFIDFQ